MLTVAQTTQASKSKSNVCLFVFFFGGGCFGISEVEGLKGSKVQGVR